MSFSMTKQEREDFLADIHVGVLSIAVEGRGPVAIPIWYSYQPGGELRFCTDKGSKKVKLLEKAGRFSLCVQDEERPYKYVSVEGPIIAIEPCDLDRDRRPIARRYMGVEDGDRYVDEMRDTQSVLIRMRPERWSSADYSKESG